MTIVRQLPKLYIRGSLATQTMSGLTDAQKEEVDRVFELARTSPSLSQHRINIITQLRNTIGADYRSAEHGEQEFNIAVWKATVDLLHHRDYSYKCEACGSSRYLTKHGTYTAIDRIRDFCPNCHKVLVDEPGDLKIKPGTYIDIDELQILTKSCERQPVVSSPIQSIAGEKKYADPYAIINDDAQFRRFYGEYIWNFFRQQINENSITTQYRQELIYERADIVLFRELISLCKLFDVDCSYDKRIIPDDGVYRLQFKPQQTPPEFTQGLLLIVARAKIHDINLKITDDGIEIKESICAETIEGQVRIPEHIVVYGDSGRVNADDDDDSSSYIGNRAVSDDDLALVDVLDVVEAIRNQLPDNECRKIWDISYQQGDTYREYVAQFGEEKPSTAHLSEFLGISTRSVSTLRAQIRTICIAHDFVPG